MFYFISSDRKIYLVTGERHRAPAKALTAERKAFLLHNMNTCATELMTRRKLLLVIVQTSGK
jgi:hypothetical protein